MQNNPFNETIEKLNKTSEEVDKITRENNEESQEKEESEKNDDPAYVLYNAITESSISLLQNEAVVNTFKEFANVAGENVAKSMIEMFAILLTQSAYQALLFYDGFLKQELDAQFNHFAEHINVARADIEAHGSVLKVLRKQLNDIQNEAKVKDFAGKNNINTETK